MDAFLKKGLTQETITLITKTDLGHYNLMNPILVSELRPQFNRLKKLAARTKLKTTTLHNNPFGNLFAKELNIKRASTTVLSPVELEELQEKISENETFFN